MKGLVSALQTRDSMLFTLISKSLSFKHIEFTTFFNVVNFIKSGVDLINSGVHGFHVLYYNNIAQVGVSFNCTLIIDT
jgi:hypothetical protein